MQIASIALVKLVPVYEKKATYARLRHKSSQRM